MSITSNNKMNRKAILVFVGVFILIGTVLLNTSQTWADAGDLTFVEFQKDGVNGVDGLYCDVYFLENPPSVQV